MYIAPGQGETAPRGQNFDVNRNALSLYPFVASFKEISLKSHCPGGEDKVLMLTEMSFVASFKKMSLKSDCKQFFT